METTRTLSLDLSSYFEKIANQISIPFTADIKNEIVRKLDSTGESYSFRDHGFYMEAKIKNMTYLVAGVINSHEFNHLKRLAETKENIIYFVHNVKKGTMHNNQGYLGCCFFIDTSLYCFWYYKKYIFLMYLPLNIKNMKHIFWTSVFWLALVAGFLGYIKWFDFTNIGPTLAAYVITLPENTVCATPALDTTGIIDTEIGLNTGEMNNFINTNIETQPQVPSVDTKLDTIQQQLKDIAEKLDIQNSNTPDAVNLALRTSKKTSVWIFPLDGSIYTKYTLNPSDDILRDTLNILFTKSAFTVVDTKLDADGNLTLQLSRVPGSSFGGSAMVEQVRTAIEKTALQFPQIKKVIITPEEILQP